MKKIYIYSGAGAYQAKDVENCLVNFDLDYERLCEHDLDMLKQDGIFIVPGGSVGSYLPAWGTQGAAIIRQFVSGGGTYVGLCGGAYVAGSLYGGHVGLGFFNSELTRLGRKGIVTVSDGEKSIDLVLENGPDFSTIPGKIFLKDDHNHPYATHIKTGNGQALLFAAHPEGSVYYQKYPKKFSGAQYFIKLLGTL